MNKSFLDEYNSQDAVLKYSTKTAGQGVNYLIQHDYARVYDQAIDACRATSGPASATCSSSAAARG